MAAMVPARATCVTNNHPLRRPRKGKLRRSTTGDHKNLSEYGKLTRLKKPMAVRFTPATVIHA